MTGASDALSGGGVDIRGWLALPGLPLGGRALVARPGSHTTVFAPASGDAGARCAPRSQPNAVTSASKVTAISIALRIEPPGTSSSVIRPIVAAAPALGRAWYDPPMSRLDEAYRLFDEANAEDPNTEIVDGTPVPRELVYGRRMSERLDDFEPDAPETVKLAARAQHIRRWEVPRESYPEGRAGYLKWRTDLYKRHGEIAGDIMRNVGYDDATIERVQTLLKKRGLKTDPDVQLLEDVICLVFLEHYFHDFAKKHEDDKLIPIVQKTWKKMTDKGHGAALALDYAPEDLAVIHKALETA